MGTGLRLMRWMDLYATGIEKIDRQHETLTDLLNALNEAFRGGRPNEVLLFRLDQLIESTHEHFTDEEALMRRKEYPDIDLHKAEHDFLLAQVAHFREEFAASKAELLRLDDGLPARLVARPYPDLGSPHGPFHQGRDRVSTSA